MKHLFLTLISGLLLAACQPAQTEAPSAKTSPANYNAQGKKAMLWATSRDNNDRLAYKNQIAFEPAAQPLETEYSIWVQPNSKFQEFVGIGGAITDASAEVFAQLSDERKKALLDAYYGPHGINYSLMRTTIHSSDFASESYTYVTEGDTALSSFTVAHDTLYRIPLIRRAIAQADSALKLYASPWSPPAFMKTNRNMLRGGKLRPEYAAQWARYYGLFVKAYAAQGIDIWGLTVQNEPMATQTWESCIYTAEEERDFVRDHLGPQLQRDGLGQLKLIVWDHNRDLMAQRAHTILSDPEAAKYIWGLGFHWYETWTGAEPQWNNLSAVHEAYPNVNLIFTEGCNEKFDAAKYQFWPNAERYGKSMINDFNRGTVAWTDWNILLDQNGGPNHVGNFCFAPVHADTRSDSLIFTPSYYYIGHFSKFIRPGAHRVSTASSRSHLLATTFCNTDNSLATVVMNPTDEAIEYRLYIGSQAVKTSIPPHSIQTLVY